MPAPLTFLSSPLYVHYNINIRNVYIVHYVRFSLEVYCMLLLGFILLPAILLPTRFFSRAATKGGALYALRPVLCVQLHAPCCPREKERG